MASSSPLSLTIRFSSSLPDLPLTLAEPSQTSTLSLITQIRASLPSTDTSSTARIRLIYSGRVLPLTSSVTEALRLPPPPPRNKSSSSSKDKPKNHHNNNNTLQPSSPSFTPKIYIHAHFSEPLSASALAEELSAATDADQALLPSTSPLSPSSPTSTSRRADSKSKGKQRAADSSPLRSRRQSAASTTTTTTSPAAQPQGFDRLLAAGLSQMEVASLRSQFVAQLAHSRTPDTMPSAAELRVLEERWLDNDSGPGTGADGSSSAAAAATAATGGGIRRWFGMGAGNAAGAEQAPTGFLADEDAGGLEDMLWGNVMGFFWPVAAVIWLMREEGVWSPRKRVAVATGFLVNLAFGIMRAAG